MASGRLGSRRQWALVLLLLLSATAVCAQAFFNFHGGGRHAHTPPAQARRPPDVDYYKVLGLDDRREAATEKDIRQEYRRLSRLHHPDVARTEADKAKYSDVNRAYEVLSDKRKRKVYDMRGERGLEQLAEMDRTKAAPGGGGNPLAQLFGMRADNGLRGPNTEVEATVELASVYTGARVPMQVNKHKVCHACKGSGADAKAAVVQCRQCGGHGVLRQRIQFAPGMIQEVQQQCPACGGSGQRPERVCSVCKGKKIVYGSSSVVLELEPGMTEGHVLTFEMEAEESPDRLPGDLLVRVRTQPHPVFSRRRNQLDLDTALSLTLKEALLGFNRSITHLDGVEQVNVVQRDTVTAYDSVLRLTGRGMPKLHVPSERGDLYVRLRYELPARLTEEQKALVERLL
ncbi:chaperone protein DNAj [Novymonas esmeraldas]|uniref:Chaperone protein DNAj n=1 Tax=Novymonas esmeraldas TaxID=1808958 RepID=A0AAW0EQQ8_9TRYP